MKEKNRKVFAYLLNGYILFWRLILLSFAFHSQCENVCARGGRTAMAHGIHGYVAIFIFFLSYFFCILNESLYPVSINQTTIIANMHEIKRFHVSGLSAYDYVATAIYILGTHCTHTHHTPYRSRMH